MQEQENSQAETSLMHYRWKIFIYDGFVDALVSSKEVLNSREGEVSPNNGVCLETAGTCWRVLLCVQI